MVEKKISELLKTVFNTDEFNLLYNYPLNKNYPYQNYLGINFNEADILNLKLYFSFFVPPPLDFVKKIIPDTSNYEKFIVNYIPSSERTFENNGITFSLKIDEKKIITKGYHFRFDNNVCDMPKIKSFKVSKDDILNVGICEEFNNAKYIKYYYYFKNIYNKQKFALRFNKPHLIVADLIEYTESDNFNKIIGCNVSANPFYNKFLSFNSPLVKHIDNLLVSKIGLNDNIADGFYENSNIESKYYFKLNSLNIGTNDFSLPENYHINTLNQIINYLR